MRKSIHRIIKKTTALMLVFLILIAQISGSFKVYADDDTTTTIERVPVYTQEQAGADRSPAKNQTGYTHEVRVHIGSNTITYKNYLQTHGPWCLDPFLKTSTIADSGCSISSIAILLTGYGLNVTPATINAYTHGQMPAFQKCIEDHLNNISVEDTKSDLVQKLTEAMKTNTPVIAYIGNEKRQSGPWKTTSKNGHFYVICGYYNGCIYTADPGTWNENTGRFQVNSTIENFVKNYVDRLIIPSKPPVPGENHEVTDPTNPPSKKTTGGNWSITTSEIPNLDELGEFEFPGNPKGMTLTKDYFTLEDIFEMLADFFDYLLGLLFYIVKAAIVGTVENIENFINDLILRIEGKQGEDIHYTIEDLVYNRVPAFNPMLLSGMEDNKDLEEPISSIQKLVAGWYVSIRNLSILALFVMLIYTGLRMALSQIADKKADYKQQLITWLKCLAIIFVLHYIIFFIFWLNGSLIQLFDPGSGGDENLLYNTIKSRAYDIRLSVGWAGAVMYIALFIFWLKFLGIYIKRLLKIIVLIVIAPFVIARYALDNATAKGKRAFDDWIYEFISSVFVQSLHALEYSILMAIAVNIALESIMGFILALIFMSQILALDETILGIIQFRGHDLGAKIKPLKQKIDVNTFIELDFMKKSFATGVGVASAGISTVGKFGKFVNKEIKESTGKDYLGGATRFKNNVLNWKDNLLRRTIGSLNDDYDSRLKLQIQSRELDKNNRSTYKANIAKRELRKYNTDKKKKYKMRRDQFFKKNRLLQIGVGAGKAMIGFGMMPTNVETGVLLATGATMETYKSIRDHNKNVEEYKKNEKKIGELEDTIKNVNRSNQLEDEIDTSIYNMKNPKEQKKAIEELKRLSEIDSNNKFVEKQIKEYMFKNNIYEITEENIDEILTNTFDEIDRKGIITQSERRAIIKAEKRKLKQQARKRFNKDNQDQENNNKRNKFDNNDNQGNRSNDIFKNDYQHIESEEERIAKHRQQYESRFSQGDVAKMFTSTVQENLISKENAFLGNKINELKDINFTSKDKNKRNVNNTRMFMENLGNRYISKEG